MRKVDRISELERELADVSGKLEQAQKDKTRDLKAVGSAAYQVLGCLFGIKGPARIMEWFHALWESGEIPDAKLFPITPEERAKYEWRDSAESRQRVLEQALREIIETCTASLQKGKDFEQQWWERMQSSRKLAESALAQGEPARTEEKN